jgi:hypothetical protein
MKQSYIILYHAEADEIARMVSSALSDGYVLAGSAYHNGHVHYQPMVLLELSSDMRTLDMLEGGSKQ